MNPHSKLKFFLGIIRHPSQSWRRIQELMRIVCAPSLSVSVPSGVLTDVEVIPVLADESLQERLVAMYVDNPSPYANGPKSTEQLQEELACGIRFFMFENRKGEFVGARAFDPTTKTVQYAVTDFRHRGKGYQLAAGHKLKKLLAYEGHTELRATVLRRNTRIQRVMQAAGWEMEPDPDNPDLIRGTLRLDS